MTHFGIGTRKEWLCGAGRPGLRGDAPGSQTQPREGRREDPFWTSSCGLVGGTRRRHVESLCCQRRAREGQHRNDMLNRHVRLRRRPGLGHAREGQHPNGVGALVHKLLSGRSSPPGATRSRRVPPRPPPRRIQVRVRVYGIEGGGCAGDEGKVCSSGGVLECLRACLRARFLYDVVAWCDRKYSAPRLSRSSMV